MRKCYLMHLGCCFLAAGGMLATRPAAAQRELRSLPENTVVEMRLDQRIDSRTAHVGDRVSATVDEADRSGFPLDTRFEGSITEVRHAADGRPAEIGVEIRRAILPGGERVSVTGELTSLADADVRTISDGRLLSRHADRNVHWTWIGLSGTGGAALGEVFSDGFIKGTLLGERGGAVYGYANRDHGPYHELELKRGTPFGVRLERSVTFDVPAIRREKVGRRDSDRVLGERAEFPQRPLELRLNGEPIRYVSGDPVEIGSTLYLPLREVANTLHWGYRHARDADQFTLFAPGPDIRGEVGEPSVTRAGHTYALDAAPLRINGEIYVPLEYLGRVGDLQVTWDRRARRLQMDTYGSAAAANPLRERLDVGALFDGLVLVDTATVRAELPDYRTVRAEDALNRDDLRLLDTRVGQNSLARRNRDLLTSLLRSTNTINGTQRVVGVAGHTIYVR